MTHPIQLFAAARDLLGTPTVAVQSPTTVADVRRQLVDRYPTLAALLPKCRIAVNYEFADDDDAVPSGAEIAVIPPVSGG